VQAADFTYLDAPTPIGLAHRGGARYEPNRGLENSLPAFRAAVAMGYRYLETDVHATSDGHLLAFHDRRLDRVSTGTGRIARSAYAVIQEARINGSAAIPLLSELFEEFPQARINIDVKSVGAIEPLARAIWEHGAVERVCLASFSERRLHAVRRLLGPRVATAAGHVGVSAMRFAPSRLHELLATPAPVLQVPARLGVGRHAVPVVTRDFVERAHRLGKHVHAWTVDDADDMRRLFDLGVDGIVSDRIDTLRDVLAERGQPLRPPQSGSADQDVAHRGREPGPAAVREDGHL
jgi:glycerophosphoryl diester phosphodiesterase